MANDFSPSVLISGGGPTGLTAALELRRFGIPVRIVDESEGPATTSRAIGIQARTLEEMELRRLADEFVRLGHHATGGDIYSNQKLLAHVDFTRIPSRYNYILFLSQTETDRILRDALEGEGAAVEWGVKMTAFGQNPSGIIATLEHMDGSVEEVKASYVIDAEGAHSIIRDTLDLDFKGKTFEETFVLGDVHIEANLPNSDFHIFSSEQGFLGLFPLGGSEFRLIASHPLTDPAQSAAPELNELQTIYDQRSHIPARLRHLTWSSFFHINSRMVEKLRVSRIFLAGDAAHIHSPAGAQGMNTGIQDAMNLGWKLALVLHGRAPETLLDTYEQDRLPVMRSIVARTETLTDILGAHSVLRGLFVHLTPWIAHAEFVHENATARISQIALNYRSSPLSEEHFGDGSLAAGDRVPDLAVHTAQADTPSATQRLFSLLDPSRFTLLLANFADPAALQARLSDALSPWGDLFRIAQISSPEGEAQKPYAETFGTAASITLVRPDAYIGFRGGEATRDYLVNYFKQWLSPVTQKQAA